MGTVSPPIDDMRTSFSILLRLCPQTEILRTSFLILADFCPQIQFQGPLFYSACSLSSNKKT